MGSSSVPQQDYVGAAIQTSAGNQNAALANQKANTTNQNTPTYNTTFTPNVDTSYIPSGLWNVMADSQKENYLKTGNDIWGNQPMEMGNWTEDEKNSYFSTGRIPDSVIKDKRRPVTFKPLSQTQNVVLSPEQQKLYESSTALNQGMLDIAAGGDTSKLTGGLKRVADAVNQDLTYNPLATSVGTTADQMTRGVDIPDFNGQIADAGQIKSSVNSAGQIVNQLGDVGAIANGIQDAGEIQRNIGYAGQIARGIAPSGKITTNANANAQAVDNLKNNANQIQTNTNLGSILGSVVNNSNAIKTSTGVDPTLLNQQAQDALYKANTQYLDPQFAQSQQALESKLANQGITKGSEAYNAEMLNFANQKQQAYESARNNAIGGSIAAAQGLYGMNLQNAEFTNQGLGQQFGQNLSAAQLKQLADTKNNDYALAQQAANNSALGQAFGQNLTANKNTNEVAAQNNATNLANAGFTNQAQQQTFAQNQAKQAAINAAQSQKFQQNQAELQAANAAQGQQFGQNQAQQQAFNTAQQQAYNEALASAGFTNEAQQQLYNQNLSDTQLANAAQGQQFGQNQARQQATNVAAKDMFNAGITNANLNNEALAQQYSQGLGAAEFQNNASAQDFALQQAQQQNPLNILQAMRTGAQLQAANIPQVAVNNGAQAPAWQGADILGATQLQQQQDIANANAKNSLLGSIIGGVTSLGGALGGASILKG